MASWLALAQGQPEALQRGASTRKAAG